MRKAPPRGRQKDLVVMFFCASYVFSSFPPSVRFY
jgi:hypothetical protein